MTLYYFSCKTVALISINFAITIDNCLVDLIYIVYFKVFRLQYHSKEKEDKYKVGMSN